MIVPGSECSLSRLYCQTTFARSSQWFPLFAGISRPVRNNSPDWIALWWRSLDINVTGDEITKDQANKNLDFAYLTAIQEIKTS